MNNTTIMLKFCNADNDFESQKISYYTFWNSFEASAMICAAAGHGGITY